MVVVLVFVYLYFAVTAMVALRLLWPMLVKRMNPVELDPPPRGQPLPAIWLAALGAASLVVSVTFWAFVYPKLGEMTLTTILFFVLGRWALTRLMRTSEPD